MSLKKLFNNYAARLRGEHDEPVYLTAPPPPVKEAYVLRETQEEELFQMLKRRGTQILLHGSGGTGKTHMARKLFYRLAGEYQRLAWVEYGSDMYSALLSTIRIPNQEADSRVEFYQVIDQLTEDVEDTILFIDDAKENAAEDDILARITGLGITILVTSRCSNIAPYDSRELLPISADECVEFFYKYYPYDRKQTRRTIVEKLAGQLDCNIMSILLLARVIGKEKNLERYFRKLDGNHFGIQEHIGRLLVFADLTDEEYRVLQCLSLMPNGETPNWIIDCFGIDVKVLAELEQKGWIEENISQNTYILHDVIREYLVKDKIPDKLFSVLIQYLSQASDLEARDLEEQRQYKVESMERVIGLANVHCAGYPQGCIWLGDQYYEQDKLGSARKYYERALNISKKTSNLNQLSIGVVYCKLGEVFSKTGKYQLAINNYEKALKIMEGVTERDYRTEAYIHNNMGTSFETLGEYNQALQHHKESLEIRQRYLDENDPHIASSYNNIGVAYDDLGDHSLALEYFQKALEIQRKVFGEDNPDTASSYNNIGTVWAQNKDYLQALSYYKKALDIRCRILGENHPDIASSFNNIGNIYFAQEEYDVALDYYKKGLRIQTQTMGEYHPDTAGSYYNIGLLYASWNKYNDSFEHHRKALEIRKRVLGENHPEVANSYNSIALLCIEMEKYEEALNYEQEALSVMEKKLPPDHPTLENIQIILDFIHSKLNN